MQEQPFQESIKIMTATQASSYQCIAAAEAAALIRDESNIALFDVRDPADYRQGHVADAAHLSEERLPAWFRRLPKDQAVVIYCYKGNASKAYAQMFADFRFTRVFSVDGGYGPLAAVLAEGGA
jgi:thiosulfate sulfurtransferase